MSSEELRHALKIEQGKVAMVQDNYRQLSIKYERLWNQTNDLLMKMTVFLQAVNAKEQDAANARLSELIAAGAKIDAEMKKIHEQGHPALKVY